MVDESALRQQFLDAFENAEYPVNNPMELVPALPDGPGTRFESGEFSMTAMELSSTVSDAADFPYEDVESLVDDLMTGLREDGHI